MVSYLVGVITGYVIVYEPSKSYFNWWLVILFIAGYLIGKYKSFLNS